MKFDIKAIQTDIRAALYIGKSESIWVALEGLLQYPEVLGNNEIETPFLRKIILPVGIMLRHPNFSIQVLEEMQIHPQAAVRAVAACSIVDHFFHQSVSKSSLLKSVNDGREEVRNSVALAIAKLSGQFPDECFSLIKELSIDSNENSKFVATQSIGFMHNIENEILTEIIMNYPVPSEVALKASLRDCLVNFANQDQADFVIKYLQQSIDKAEGINVKDLSWVAAKTIGRSWAANNLEEVFSIISQIAEITSEHKQLLNALQSIARHSGIDTVKEYVKSIPVDQSENLAEFSFVANKVLS